MYDPEIGRWIGPDPLTEKYPEVSPYTFTLNNPMRFVDPDGRDVWEINEDGSIAKRTEDKTQDAFHMVNADGQRIDGQSIVFKYGTITGVTNPVNSKGESSTIFSVQGDDNATQLFEFMANPGETTNVEWSHVKIGTEESQRNWVGTSHSDEKTSVGGYAFEQREIIRENNHSHPGGTKGASDADIKVAKSITNRYPDAKTNIYTTNPSTYTPFDRNSTPVAYEIPPVYITVKRSQQ